MKAAEEMTREELIAYDKWLTRRKWGTGEIISPEKAADLYLAEQPLPPAEGAEQAEIIIDDWFHEYCEGRCEKSEMIAKLTEFAAQQQPTAEGAEKLQKLMTDISEWSNKTFGDGQRNPAIVYHLKKEVNELIAVFEGNPRNAHRQLWFEYADCLMLLLDSALHAGFTARDLIDATREKLEINKTRKWGKPDENGVIEHVEQPQPTAEGAEEIDDETIAYAAEYQCGTPFSERWIGFVKGAKWHRSLHAQRIADKMVSERDDKLLQQRDELKEALAEQKRLYFSLFDEETSCMYCEAKIRRGSAIILCKECAESTEV